MFKLSRFLKSYKKELILGPFFKLLEAIFELIVPLVMARIIDIGIKNSDKTYVWSHIGIIVLLGVCGLAFALVCQYFAAKCGFGFGTDLRASLYKHINGLSHSEIDTIGTSSLTTRLINDTFTAQIGVNMFIRLAVRAPFLIIGAAVMAMTLDIKLSLIFLAAVPLIILVLWLIMTKSVPMYKTVQKKLDRISLSVRENLDGVKVIRAFSKQRDAKEKFHKESDELTECVTRVGKLSAWLNPSTFVIMNLAIAAVLWFGGIRVDEGSLTQGQITAFVNYMTQILLALVVLANLIVIFTKAAASANRINEVFEITADIEGGNDVPDTNNDTAIEFRNVSFAYNKDAENALNHISFTLKKGQTLGIIGGTGSGKSTVSALMERFYDTDSGDIMIFGKNVKGYTLSSLRMTIGTVMQKSSLSSGTLMDNMRWAKSDATEDEIIKALKIAQSWDFVEKKPDKLNMQINAGGKNLSGGQRQRICIARALIGSPAIVILDDSMSALDYATDLKLRQALKSLDDVSFVIISQRASTLADADTILVLDDGNIAGLGTHNELYDNCEVYREICDAQQSREEA